MLPGTASKGVRRCEASQVPPMCWDTKRQRGGVERCGEAAEWKRRRFDEGNDAASASDTVCFLIDAAEVALEVETDDVVRKAAEVVVADMSLTLRQCAAK